MIFEPSVCVGDIMTKVCNSESKRWNTGHFTQNVCNCYNSKKIQFTINNPLVSFVSRKLRKIIMDLRRRFSTRCFMCVTVWFITSSGGSLLSRRALH
jgi:hypothetical protein